jgi:hypothetical protein
MRTSRKPLARIEGRRRLKLSGLTIAWRGTPNVDDWVAYIVTGTKSKKRILADHVSEREVKALLSRVQSLSKRNVEKLASQTEYPEGIKAINEAALSLLPPSYGTTDQAAGHDHQATSRLSASAAQAAADPGLDHNNEPPGEESLLPRVTSAIAQWSPKGQGLFSHLSQILEGQKRLEARLEMLERENQQVRAEIADLFDGEPEPPSIFDTGWFRSALVLLILAIVGTVTVPYLLALWEASPSSSPAAHSRVTEPGPRLDPKSESLGTFFSPHPPLGDEPVGPDVRVPAKDLR